MTPTFKFLKTPSKSSETIIIPIFSDLKLSATASDINKKSNGLIQDILKSSKEFKAKAGTQITITLPSKSGFTKLILLGLGDAKKLTMLSAEENGGKLFKTLTNSSVTHATIAIPAKLKNSKISSDTLGAHLANGAKLASYTFNKYKKSDKTKGSKLKRIDIVNDFHANTAKTFETLNAITQGTFLARDLINEPPNELYPESFAQIIKDELKPLGVDIEILDEKKMLKLGMGAIMAVGQGSIRQPRMVIMRWNGLKGKTKSTDKPFALVGKGVTFDTGGISLKPGAGMDEMKMDMGGAAAVVGAMKALALRKAKANVIGAVGLAENMPSERAYRPGDIIKSLSGKTIEVLNTDAEGRLVLCDVLTHVQNTYSPHTIIDLATLTGAMMVALGNEYCGTFANDDKLWNAMESASENTGEKLWRMPLDPLWRKEMEGRHADLQNMGKSRYAGACTAAGFLEHFIEKDTKWAHMDIAGTAWIKSDKPTTPKYGTGFGVRVLNDIIKTTAEK